MTTERSERLADVARLYLETRNGRETMRLAGCGYRFLSEALDAGLLAIERSGPGRPRRDYPGLGTATDRGLAKDLGLSPSAVTKARQRRGIPPYTPTMPTGVPVTGEDLLAYRKAAGLSGRRMAAALLRLDGSTYTHQGVAIAEKRGGALSPDLAATIHRAIQEERLPPLE